MVKVNKIRRTSKVQSKMDNPEKSEKKMHTRRQPTKQKHNIICVGHYTQKKNQIQPHIIKSLTIPKWLLKPVNRRTDNSMAKIKKDKLTRNDLQKPTQRPKDRTIRILQKA